MTKRILAALCAAAAAGTILVSCGNDNGGTSEDSSPKADAAAASEAADTNDTAEAPAPSDTSESPDGLYASIQHVTDTPDWIKALPEAQNADTKQLFVVGAMGMDLTTATVSMNERDENGDWKQILTSPAYVGVNGMVRDAERAVGCGRTPIGTYRFTAAFGIADDPGCAMPYTKVDEDIYWSGDTREGMHYNEMVDIKDLPDLDTGECEHIIDYEYPYRYCLNIGFNEEGTPDRGAAIFLHCIGSQKPYTSGCVSVPENIMKLIMQKVSPDCVVVIGLFDEMGGNFG